MHCPANPRGSRTDESSSADQFRLALEAAPAGMLMMDSAGRIVLVNAQIEKLFGYERSELIGQSLEMLLPDRYRAGRSLSRQSPADGRARQRWTDVYGLRKDGSEIPIEIGLNPLRTPEGAFVLSSVVDITERKRFEAALQEQLRERDVLLQEIHHRVKNNLQVISSLISLQLGRMEPGRSYDALQECSLRVLAIAHIHEQLYLSKDFARVPFSEYAHNLAGDCLSHDGRLAGAGAAAARPRTDFGRGGRRDSVRADPERGSSRTPSSTRFRTSAAAASASNCGGLTRRDCCSRSATTASDCRRRFRSGCVATRSGCS